jgi:protein involved in polysaccharide export with SLBB domain
MDNPLITIAGLVKKPGSYVFHRGMTAEDLIVMAGGFNTNADNNKIQISRLQKNRADTLANQLIDLITVGIDSNLKSNNSIALEPFDYIMVPELLNYHVLGNVIVRGEVLYPGDYRLEKRNQTIQDVLKSAGGISPFAKLSDVQVFRNNLRVATNLLSETANSNNQFLLQPNDSIFIPKNVPFVEVKGAVFNPQILNYEGGSMYSYIVASGGATDKAHLKRAYIQYSNGINKKTRHFFFFRNFPRVQPGSKIIVPEKSPNERRVLSIGEISAIAGVLTSLVTLAISLKL